MGGAAEEHLDAEDRQQGLMNPVAPVLTQDEAFARIRLLRSPNIGPISFRQLLARFGTACAALDALPDLASRGGKGYRAAPEAWVSAEVAALRAAGGRYVFHDSPEYPALLAEVDSAPPILMVRGDLALAARYCDDVVVMQAGQAATQGAPDLALSDEILARVFGIGAVRVAGDAGRAQLVACRPLGFA